MFFSTLEILLLSFSKNLVKVLIPFIGVKNHRWEMVYGLYIYLYVMYSCQSSMLVIDLSNKKNRTVPGFLSLYARREKV